MVFLVKNIIGQFYLWFNLSVKLLFSSIVSMKSLHGFDKGMDLNLKTLETNNYHFYSLLFKNNFEC